MTVFLTVMLGLSSVRGSAQTVTLNLKDTTCVNWQTDIYPGNYANCEGGGFWTNTYDSIANPPLCFNPFVLSHESGFSVYSYWGGFTLSVNGDSLCYSGECPNSCACKTNNPNCTLSGSNEWVLNQWGVMAGGGLSDSEPYSIVKGNPYLVGYWDYYSDSKGLHSLEIKLNGDSLFTPQEMYVCNHPWPYYGNFFGDGFARPLNQPGDIFRLIIHGVRPNGTEVIQNVTLAQYDSTAMYNVNQDANWKKVTLNQITFANIKSLYFTMYSTDSLSGYGPNTAVYFCIDKLKVTKTGKVASSVNNVQENQVFTPKTLSIDDYFPIPSYTGGEVVVYDAKGKTVFKSTVVAGEKINLSKLPKGEYSLRHGSKVIPIKKRR